MIKSLLLAVSRALTALVFAAAATPAHADFAQSQGWFERLSENQRANLQGNLVLLAHYGGMVDGAFGANTYGALIRWQQEVNVRPDGVLTSQQLDRLNQMASQVMSDLGMSLVEDLNGHLAIMLPTGLLTQQSRGSNGTIYQDASGQFVAETFWRPSSEGTLSQHYAAAAVGRKVTYSTLRADLYVVTGVDNGRYFYEMVHADGDGAAGFRFTYPEWQRETGGVASVFAASYSMPISGREVAQGVLDLGVPAPSLVELPTPSIPELPTNLTPMGPTPKSKIAAPDSNEEGGFRQFGNFLVFDDAPGVIGLVGDIGPSTPLDFRRALRAVGQPRVLALGSDGGLVSSALLLAYEVHELGMSTWVPPDVGCYSACSFIFFAGSERLAQGKLGVHQVWGNEVDASSAQTVVSDILEAFGDFGVRQEVTSAMLRTRPEDMYIFSEAELEQWNLNVGGL